MDAGDLDIVQLTLFVYAMPLKDSRFEEVVTKNADEYSNKPMRLFLPPAKCPQKDCST